MWLKVWFSQLEAAELENYEAFELTEENEHETDVIDEDIVFRLPTADEIADASRAVDRKISSTSSTCSTSSYQSSTYEGWHREPVVSTSTDAGTSGRDDFRKLSVPTSLP